MSKNEWTELVTIVEQNIIIYEHFILTELYFFVLELNTFVQILT